SCRRHPSSSLQRVAPGHPTTETQNSVFTEGRVSTRFDTMNDDDWPPLDNLDVSNDAAYEWLLSNHPWARSERIRRRAEYLARRIAEADEVVAISDQLTETTEPGHPLYDLAERVRPTAEAQALAAQIDQAVEDDDELTAQARRRW